jgi:hypothetical protein
MVLRSEAESSVGCHLVAVLELSLLNAMAVCIEDGGFISPMNMGISTVFVFVKRDAPNL